MIELGNAWRHVGICTRVGRRGRRGVVAAAVPTRCVLLPVASEFVVVVVVVDRLLLLLLLLKR